MAKASKKATGRKAAASKAKSAGKTKSTGAKKSGSGKDGSKKAAARSAATAKSAAPRKTGTTGPFGTRPASKGTASKSAKAKPSAKKAAVGTTGKAATAAKAKAKTKTKTKAKADKDAAKKAAKAAREAKKAARSAEKAGQKAAQKATKKASKKAAKKTSAKAGKGSRADLTFDAIDLFAPLTEGERYDAIRLVTETPRLAAMAKVGRYRVISVEPMVFKPPEERAGHRLARVVIFDYSSARQVDASVDLDESEVFHATSSKAQPMLSPEEEADALALAAADERVQSHLELGDEATAVMHYWSRHAADLAYTRRAAAVMFGPLGARPTLVAVVDLVDRSVAEVTPAANW